MGPKARGRPRRGVEAVLREVVERPGQSISEIAARLGLAKSTVSESVKMLEARGLVQRKRRGSMVLVYPATPPTEGVSGGDQRATQRRFLRLAILRAAEYPFVVGFSKKLRARGVEVEIRVYENGLEATLDIVLGRVDAGLTPLPTQFLAYALTKGLRIVAGGAYGGAGVVVVEAGEERVATTMASTMEACANTVLGESVERFYVGSGAEGVGALGREARYAVLWEPFLSQALKEKGAKLVAECGSIGLEHCCTLAVHAGLEEGLVRLVRRSFIEAVEEQAKRPRKWVEAYAAMVGIEASLLKSVVGEYEYNPYATPRSVEKTLRLGGLRFPSPSLSRSAVYEE